MHRFREARNAYGKAPYPSGASMNGYRKALDRFGGLVDGWGKAVYR
jgi:hypothetical protein